MSFESALLSPEQLAAKLGSSGLVLLDCRFNLFKPAAGRQAYLDGHIPGARYADLDEDLAGPIGPATGRHPLPDAADFMRRLGAWGIERDTMVVAYDDAGGAIAARAWWLLLWVGHRRVALLDGGFPAWLDSGLPLESGHATPVEKQYVGEPGQRPAVSTRELEAELRDGAAILLDARDAARFRGDIEPIDTKGGHVPAAINLPFQDNLDSEGRFLSPKALARRFAPIIGNRPADSVISMCGSGVTACHNLFALELAGFPGTVLYAGSWSEWIRSDARPIASGDGSADDNQRA